jgi:hypothetical protein
VNSSANVPTITGRKYDAAKAKQLLSGYQTCMERCIFDAVEMVKPGGSKKLKAQAIDKKSMVPKHGLLQPSWRRFNLRLLSNDGN